MTTELNAIELNIGQAFNNLNQSVAIHKKRVEAAQLALPWMRDADNLQSLIAEADNFVYISYQSFIGLWECMEGNHENQGLKLLLEMVSKTLDEGGAEKISPLLLENLDWFPPRLCTLFCKILNYLGMHIVYVKQTGFSQETKHEIGVAFASVAKVIEAIHESKA